MKKAVYALTLTLVLSLTCLTAAYSAWEPTSTCWLTCLSFGSGAKNYKMFDVTKDACCSGSALSCPPGSYSSYAWGEPAMLCGPNIE